MLRAWIYAEDHGALNATIQSLGGDPVLWLGPRVALYSIVIVIVNVWGAIGGGIIIFLAGLQAIPKEYYEVARIDGASVWQRLFYITIPALAFSIFFQIVLTTINAFQAYLPLSKPALAAFAIFAFLFSWNDLFSALNYLPSDLTKTTLTVGLALFQSQYHGQWTLISAAARLPVAPIILALFVAQRHFIQGIAMTGLC